MSYETKEGFNGFEGGQGDTTLTYDRVTRTVTVTPTGAFFKVFVAGRPFIYSAPIQVTHPDITGLYAIIIDDTGSLIAQTTAAIDADIIARNALVAIVYWNAVQGREVIFGDERHGLMDSFAHAHFHEAFGAQIERDSSLGTFSITGFVTDGGGDVDSDAWISFEPGTLLDEDVRLPSTATPQSLGTGTGAGTAPSVGAEAPTIFKYGVNGDWYIQDVGDKTGDFVMYQPSTSGGTTPTGVVYADDRQPFNEFTGTTWQLTEVPNNGYVLLHIFAWNAVASRIVGVMGQSGYSSVADARAAAFSEIQNIVFGDLPLPEFRPLFTVLIESADGDTNGVNCDFEDIDPTTDQLFIDWRFNNIGAAGSSGGGGGSTTFAALTDTDVVGVAAGATLHYDGANWIDLPIGTAGQVLTVNAGATAPEWAAGGSGGVSDLQGAYDGGNAIVLAAATPVTITAATPGTEDALTLRGRINMEGATDSVVIGNTFTDVDGADSVYVGNNIDGNAGGFHYALGADITFTGLTSAVAVGNTITVAQDAVAVGVSVAASGLDSTAVGRSTVASGTNSTALGTSTDATATDATAIGRGAQATNSGSLAIGVVTEANALESLAIGFSAHVRETVAGNSNLSVAIGHNAHVDDASTAVAIGRNASVAAGSNRGVVIGDSASAPAGHIHAVAIGYNTHANNDHAIVIGTQNTVNSGLGVDSIAIGRTAVTAATESIAIGHDADALGLASVALGSNTSASGSDSFAFGRNAVANSTDSIAIGLGVNNQVSAITNRAQSVSIGRNSESTGTFAINIGDTSRGAQESIALGRSAEAQALRAVAIGRYAVASGTDSVAIGGDSNAGTGNGTTATGVSSIAIGDQVSALQNSAIVIGQDSESSQIGDIIIGSGIVASPTVVNGSGGNIFAGNGLTIESPSDAIVIGRGASLRRSGATLAVPNPTGSCDNSTVIGRNAYGSGTNALAIGVSSSAGVGGTAVGYACTTENLTTAGQYAEGFAAGGRARADGARSVAIGFDLSLVGPRSSGVDSIAIGSRARVVSGGLQGIAIGYDAGNGTSGDAGAGVASNAIAIGTQTNASAGTCIAIGNSADATSTGNVAIGTNAQALSTDNVAIGDNARAESAYSTAIGTDANALGGFSGSTVIGAGATSSGAGAIAIGRNANADLANRLVIGSDLAPIFAAFIGRGRESATPNTNVSINATNASAASGANGSNLQLQGGLGDGAGVDGYIELLSAVQANASVGTAGQVLTSRGAGLSPEWAAGGASTLQSAYDGGRSITVATAGTPVQITANSQVDPAIAIGTGHILFEGSNSVQIFSDAGSPSTNEANGQNATGIGNGIDLTAALTGLAIGTQVKIGDFQTVVEIENGIGLGFGLNIQHNYCIALGSGLTSTKAGQVLIGQAGGGTEFVFGQGAVSNFVATDVLLKTTDGQGLDNGSNMQLQAGLGTGTGSDGYIELLSALQVNSSVGSAGQLLESRGAGQSPVWREPTYAGIFASGTENVSIVASATYVKLNGLDQAMSARNSNPDTSNSQVTAGQTGDYLVSYSISALGTEGNSYRVAAAVNGTAQASSDILFGYDSTTAFNETASCSTIVSLLAGDNVTLVAQNIGATNNLFVTEAKLNIVRID